MILNIDDLVGENDDIKKYNHFQKRIVSRLKRQQLSYDEFKKLYKTYDNVITTFKTFQYFNFFIDSLKNKIIRELKSLEIEEYDIDRLNNIKCFYNYGNIYKFIYLIWLNDQITWLSISKKIQTRK